MNLKMRTNLYSLVLLLLLTVGCSDESVVTTTGVSTNNTELPGGYIDFELHTSAPGFERPVTRADNKADEDNVSGNAWVFVFDARSPHAADPLFLEAAKATIHEAVGTGATKRTVKLQTRSHPVAVVILDNTPTHYFNGTDDVAITDDPASWGLTPGAATYSQAAKRLSTVQLPAPLHDSIPYIPNLPIPMSERFDLPNLSGSSGLGTEAAPKGLRRVVARLTVTKIDTAPNLSLKAATVHSVPRNASLFPVHKENASNLTNYVGDTNPITDIAAADAAGVTTDENPIYLYPSAEDNSTNQPFVLIQARYAGDTQDTYYKLQIAPAGKPTGHVERNTNYQLLINECSGRGYANLADAVAAPPSDSIKYDVQVTDLTSHDIIDNGQYYLALSNSEYQIYHPSSAAMNDVTICTITHNAPTGVKGTISAGATASPSANINGNGDIRTFTLVVSNLNVGTQEFTITLGNLTKKITVHRSVTDAHFNSWAIGKVAQAEFIDPVTLAPTGAPPTWLEFNYSPLGAPDKKVYNTASFDTSKNVYLYSDEYVDPANTDTYTDRTATIRLFSMDNAPTGTVGNVGNIIINYTQRSAEYVGLFGGQKLPTASGYNNKLFVERIEENTSMQWGFSSITTGVTELINGRVSTHTLAARTDAGVTDYPARYCLNKNRDINSNGVIDLEETLWYAPARFQMQAVYISQTAYTDKLKQENYWTATENSSTVALYEEFNLGSSNSATKSTSCGVRCVRETNP